MAGISKPYAFPRTPTHQSLRLNYGMILTPNLRLRVPPSSASLGVLDGNEEGQMVSSGKSVFSEAGT